ncbi:DNA-binding protein [Myxozyma melibiosi]|uniref:DNA-binding protein n=1 Tax=Myxozyma melibiosi TaxID=54550 RepID=A0ABR1F9A8_9ASCO
MNDAEHLRASSSSSTRATTPVLPRWTYSELLSIYAEFLVVSVHTILFERRIYPAESFFLARKYNYPVRQSRHPEVCEWVRNAVSACVEQMRTGEVSRISVVLISVSNVPLERVVFDVSGFPKIPLRDQDRDLKNIELKRPDMDEQFRVCIMKLSTMSPMLGTLPTDCTFTITIELNDDAEAPTGPTSKWVPAESQPQERDPLPEVTAASDDGNIAVNGNVKTPPRNGMLPKFNPLRHIYMGPLSFDVWVEESKAKEKLPAR